MWGVEKICWAVCSVVAVVVVVDVAIAAIGELVREEVRRGAYDRGTSNSGNGCRFGLAVS